MKDNSEQVAETVRISDMVHEIAKENRCPGIVHLALLIDLLGKTL